MKPNNPTQLAKKKEKLYQVEVQFAIRTYNVKALSPEHARMKVLDFEEDIPVDAVVSNGRLLE
jgi:hypothetical protein